MTGIKLARDKTVGVNTQLVWLPVKLFTPPRGAKLQLIDRKLGSAHYGLWTPESSYTHWQGLPHFVEDEDAFFAQGIEASSPEPGGHSGGPQAAGR